MIVHIRDQKRDVLVAVVKAPSLKAALQQYCDDITMTRSGFKPTFAKDGSSCTVKNKNGIVRKLKAVKVR